MVWWQGLAAFFIAAWGLAFFSAPLWAWSLMLLLGLGSLHWTGEIAAPILYSIWIIVLLFLAVLNFPGFRQRFIIRFLCHGFRDSLPTVSHTEREAIDAGDVWWEGE